jgi:phage/conjugal plasmid C-4 type zinc finger TraR family protein
MTDSVDVAQDLEKRARQDALAAVLRKARSSAADPAVSRDCALCGDDIPAARLIAVPNARYCRNCQSRIEQR